MPSKLCSRPPGRTAPAPSEQLLLHSPCEQGVPAEYGLGVDDHEAMALALEEARHAPDHGDVPIGAVVLADGKVVARRHNEREQTGDPTAHAELLALRDAAAASGNG